LVSYFRKTQGNKKEAPPKPPREGGLNIMVLLLHLALRDKVSAVRFKVELVLIHLLCPLIAAEGYFFCLETKEAKIQVNFLCFFAAQGHCAAKRDSTTGCLYFAF
jgi:hypothetical protein